MNEKFNVFQSRLAAILAVIFGFSSYIP